MSTESVRFPDIRVKLTNEDANAFAIIGRVRKAMRRGGCTKEQIDEYTKAAEGGDYDHLLQVTLATVEVE